MPETPAERQDLFVTDCPPLVPQAAKTTDPALSANNASEPPATPRLF